MEFTLPTTRTEMFDTLKDIFYYYRMKRIEYDDVELKKLNLPRINYVKLTDSELTSKAEKLVAPEQTAKVRDYKSKLNERLIELTSQIEIEENNSSALAVTVTEEYDKAKNELQARAQALGVSDSTILVEQLSLLESQKAQRLTEIEQELLEKKSNILAEIESVNQAIESAEQFFITEHTEEKVKKFVEIKDEQDKLAREIQKYNNSLEEKEQRQANAILEANANLKLKFLQITSQGLSKDQLIDMGYYADVVDCVCGYYNTLPAETAFNEISNEPKLAIYLDDYYTDIVYMYQIRKSN